MKMHGLLTFNANMEYAAQPAIAASRTRLWLASGWGCRGRRHVSNAVLWKHAIRD